MGRVPLLVKIGLLELAVAALSGWLMVMRVQESKLLRRAGVRQLGRIRQMHMNFIMMGLILVGVGLAVQPLPTWIGVLLAIGALVQPVMVVPIALRPSTTEANAYKAFSGIVFTGTSIAWVALAVEVLSR